ncbi:TerB family tellurite resistance protein [Ideonella paludis]|uniref:TerB family tellurite resistance protein n=1 Tax=Ideonella paludis TaxID=1233411 RepID=A0ABS5DTG7_9BURK|nr:TerB family tellurite resistance protein [Ideonella paludis]MBQ0934435.1 TerB family tellurite resistance protein [Ideonella paludis]
MRSYPRNSPEAAARIVALVLIADGHVCRSEFEALDQLDAARALGLPTGGLPQAVQALCEDLLMGSYSGGSLITQLDEAALAALMAEVDDPALQANVLALATAAARADQHLAEGEAVVLEAARRYWRLSDAAPGLPVQEPVRLAA